jgi:5-methylthioadenosine/S-adenosylhomocysteine deaminase
MTIAAHPIPETELVQRVPGLINTHAHGNYGPQYRGVKRSLPFDVSGVNLMARESHDPSPEELFACALVTGLENLQAGNTAILDHYYGPLTHDHAYAVARAYEQIGLRAWVLLELTDLPWLCYTRDAYPRYAGAVPFEELPDELRSLVEGQPRASSEDLPKALDLIRRWPGDRVKLGLALGNPVWCSNELIRDVAAAARDLDVVLTTHVEESALQREVSLAQWGLSSVQRMKECGALWERTIIAHAVHIDSADVLLLAQEDASISHNPLSNLKLQVGLAPLGEWIGGGVNVCLGSDGQASGDSQNLFMAMKVAAALADLNGLRDVAPGPEEVVLAMATRNAARFWRPEELSRDVVEFSEPLGPFGHVWDDPAAYIAEVYTDGEPRLRSARELVEAAAAREIVIGLRRDAVAKAQVERAARLTDAVRAHLERARHAGGP